MCAAVFDDSTRMRLKGLLALVMIGAMSSSMVVLRDGAAQADLRTSAAAGPPAPAAAAPAAASLVHSTAPATSALSAGPAGSTHRASAAPRERKASAVTASAFPDGPLVAVAVLAFLAVAVVVRRHVQKCPRHPGLPAVRDELSGEPDPGAELRRVLGHLLPAVR